MLPTRLMLALFLSSAFLCSCLFCCCVAAGEIKLGAFGGLVDGVNITQLALDVQSMQQMLAILTSASPSVSPTTSPTKSKSLSPSASLTPSPSQSSQVLYPTDIASCIHFYSADVVTKDGSNFVTQWDDQIGTWPLTKGVQDNPLWIADMGAGHPTVLFDGGNDCLGYREVAQVINPPYHVFMVAKIVSWTLHRIMFNGNSNGGQSTLVYMQDSSPQLKLVLDTANTILPASIGNYMLISFYVDGTGHYFRLNDDMTAHAPSLIRPLVDGLTVGCENTFGSGGPANVEIAEFSVYNAEVTGTEYSMLVEGFRTKYNLW